MTEKYIYQAMERWGNMDGVERKWTQYPTLVLNGNFTNYGVKTVEQSKIPIGWHLQIGDYTLSIIIGYGSYTGFNANFRTDHPNNPLAELYLIDAPDDYRLVKYEEDSVLGYQTVSDIDAIINDMLEMTNKRKNN